MRKAFRITIILLLFLAGAGMLTWYLIMRRQVPQHAQCIPKDAIAVLTLNLRELALDHKAGGHLFPEMADKPIADKELGRFLKAIEKNDGPGISQTADVLGFFYREGGSAFLGVAASLKDSAKFGKLLREQLTSEFSLRPFSSAGISMMRFDTGSAFISWNNEIALFLYPISNESADKTSGQCVKLLKQTEAQSVLANENFRAHELTSFDAGIWMQPQKLIAFTGGSALLRTAFYNINYLSLACDFQDGELIIRRIITEEKKSVDVLNNSPALLTCDPKQVLGFYHGTLELKNDSLLDDYLHIHPLNLFPLDNDQKKVLAANMDGNFTILFHDTFSYNMDYITFDYDADFNHIPIHGFKRETQRGITASFGLTNIAAAQEQLSQWMKKDSIPLNGNTWLINDNGVTHYMMISENVLSISSWKEVDGKSRAVPETWDGLDIFVPIGKVVVPDLEERLSFFIPQLSEGHKLLSAHFENFLVSESLVKDGVRSSQIRITMHNKEVNALVQFEELFITIMR